jgi:hypothetical protein
MLNRKAMPIGCGRPEVVIKCVKVFVLDFWCRFHHMLRQYFKTNDSSREAVNRKFLRTLSRISRSHVRVRLSSWTLRSFLLRKGVLWSATAVLLVGVSIGLAAWGVDANPKQFLAAAALNDSAVRIDGVSCLSIGPHGVVFDQKDYSDPQLVDAIVETLAIKTVLFDADFKTCPWGFFVTVVPGLVSAVRFGAQSARYLVSIGICERTIDGTLNPSKCLDKNVYVFNPNVGPHELFAVALVGLAKSQSNEWEVFQSKRLR